MNGLLSALVAPIVITDTDFIPRAFFDVISQWLAAMLRRAGRRS